MVMEPKKCFTMTPASSTSLFIATMTETSSLAVGHQLRWVKSWELCDPVASCSTTGIISVLIILLGLGWLWSWEGLQCECGIYRRTGPTHGRCWIPHCIQVALTSALFQQKLHKHKFDCNDKVSVWLRYDFHRTFTKRFTQSCTECSFSLCCTL